MPTEIENYVHRIGRTGRCGKTGVATTFINKSVDETTLLDLKGLLREARQRIPPVLEMLEDPPDLRAGGTTSGACSFCGGLGHSVSPAQLVAVHLGDYMLALTFILYLHRYSTVRRLKRTPERSIGGNMTPCRWVVETGRENDRWRLTGC